MSFKNLAKNINSQLNRPLGDIVFYESVNGISKEIRGIVSTETIEVNSNTGEAFLTDRMTIQVDLNDISPEVNDQFTIDSVDYQALEIKKDSYGSAEIGLIGADYAE